MLNNQGAIQKFNCVLDVPAATGVVKTATGQDEFPVHIETKVRVENNSAGSTIVPRGRIIGSSVWTNLTVTSGVVDVSTYDYISFNVTVAGTAGSYIASGFLSFI